MDFFVVDFYVGTPHKIFLILGRFNNVHYMTEGSRNNSFQHFLTIYLIIYTSAGSPIMVNVFPQPTFTYLSTCLSVSKHCPVVTFHNRLDQWKSCLFINELLRDSWREYKVKSKLFLGVGFI